MDEGKTNPVASTIQDIVDAGNFVHPKDETISDYVEWILVHKRCGRPLTGMSPKNGWCHCSFMTQMPEVKGHAVEQVMGWPLDDCIFEAGRKAGLAEAAPAVNDGALTLRCETAEKENTLLKEKLDKASKKIAELVKKQ